MNRVSHSSLIQSILSLFGGILYTIGFNNTSYWLASICGCALFIHILLNTRSPREGFRYGFLFGLTAMGGVMAWVLIPSVQTLGDAPVSAVTGVLPFFNWVITSSVLALSSAFFGASIVKYKQKDVLKTILVISSAWVLFELVRSWVFFIYIYSPSALFGLHWTFGFSGYTLSETFLLALLGPFGGIYLLSALFVLLSSILAYNFRSTVRTSIIFGILFIFVYIPPIKYSDSATHKTLFIATKTTLLTHSPISNAYNQYLGQMNTLLTSIQTAFSEEKIIVLPEDSRFLTSRTQKELGATVTPRTHILDSSRTSQGDGSVISAVFAYPADSEELIVRSTKQLITPLGEYIPYFHASLLHLLKLERVLAEFTIQKAYVPGSIYTPVIIDNTPIGVTLCSDIYSPNLQREIAQDAAVLVNMASHATTLGSPLLAQQVLAMSKVRAVETNRFFIRAANYTDAFIISNRGIVVAHTDPEKHFDYIAINVPLLEKKTFYSQFPYLFPFIALLVFMTQVLYTHLRRT